MRSALWTAVVVLTVVGVAAAILRLTVVTTTLRTPVSERPLLTGTDQLSMQTVAWGLGLTPGSTEYARAQGTVVRFAAEYTAHPTYTVMHLVPGLTILLLAPFQFSPRVRTRHIRFHRWTGRTILVASIAIAISAFYFGIVRGTIHPIERPTIAIFLTLFVFAASRAYVAIRHKDVARHREWMIRTYAILIGIATVRVVALATPFFFRGADLSVPVMASWWVGWLLTVSAAELWIQYSRRRGLAQLSYL